MAKSYKKKHEEKVIVTEEATISKKEQYDLEKMKRMKAKKKEQNKKTSKLKNFSKNNSNLGSKIFAIFMLILMVGSVVVSALAYVLS